ncbi:MAG: FAD-binding oxidoreductase [Chloroflexota bacterium]|nr:FAD-binding oxidoreductase [Chloroflexota bacterium]
MTQAHEQAGPASIEEAATYLRKANSATTPVGFVGGGTKQEPGNSGSPLPLKISTGRLNRLIAYQPEDLTVTAEAGLELATLQATLGKRGQWLPLDPPRLKGETLGGLLATNANGPKRLLYGTARDLLLGCQFVLADGSIGRSGGRVVKNVSGYDLHKLMIGSFGTLGLLTEVTFKVLPLPQYSEWAAALFEKAEDALAATRQAVRSNASPVAMEILNRAAQLQMAKKTRLTLPEAPYLLFFGAEGFEAAVKEQLQAVTALCRATGAKSVIETEGKGVSTVVWNGLQDLAAQPLYNLRLKWSATLTGLPSAVKSAEELVVKLGLTDAALQIRAGTGLAYLYAKLPAESDAFTYQEVARQIELARTHVQRQEGSLVVELAPVALKEKLDVWGGAGDAFAAMQALKNKLDPKGILNRGRFLKGL